MRLGSSGRVEVADRFWPTLNSSVSVSTRSISCAILHVCVRRKQWPGASVAVIAVTRCCDDMSKDNGCSLAEVYSGRVSALYTARCLLTHSPTITIEFTFTFRLYVNFEAHKNKFLVMKNVIAGDPGDRRRYIYCLSTQIRGNKGR